MLKRLGGQLGQVEVIHTGLGSCDALFLVAGLTLFGSAFLAAALVRTIAAAGFLCYFRAVRFGRSHFFFLRVRWRAGSAQRVSRTESLPHFRQRHEFGMEVDRGNVFRSLRAAGFLNRLFEPLKRLFAQRIPDGFVRSAQIDRSVFLEELGDFFLPFSDCDLMNFDPAVARLTADSFLRLEFLDELAVFRAIGDFNGPHCRQAAVAVGPGPSEAVKKRHGRHVAH